MRRRRFMTLLGSAAAVSPLAARAQQGSTLPTIGFLHGSQTRSETADAFIQGLKDAGYIERRTSERRQKKRPRCRIHQDRVNLPGRPGPQL
jgi:hypothetical protein